MADMSLQKGREMGNRRWRMVGPTQSNCFVIPSHVCCDGKMETHCCSISSNNHCSYLPLCSVLVRQQIVRAHNRKGERTVCYSMQRHIGLWREGICRGFMCNKIKPMLQQSCRFLQSYCRARTVCVRLSVLLCVCMAAPKKSKRGFLL